MSGSTASRGYQYPEDGDFQSEFPAISRQAMERVDVDMASALSGVSGVSARVDALVRVDTSVGTRVMIADRMVYGDSGVRDIESLIPESMYTSGLLRIHRSTDLVTLWGYGIRVPDFSWGEWFRLPAGFRPRAGFQGEVGRERSNRIALNITTNGAVSTGVNAGTETSSALFAITFPAEPTWPTSLPGTPA